MIICGIYTIFVSNVIVVTIGIVILVYSVLDVIEDIIFLVNIKKLEKQSQQKDNDIKSKRKIKIKYVKITKNKKLIFNKMSFLLQKNKNKKI